MRFILLFLLIVALAGCTAPPKKLTPLETLQLYAKAIKKKDTTQMKLLLSKESMQMAENEAKAQGVTIDEIVTRQTLFSESQTSVKYRNVREDGDIATIDVEDSVGIWNTVRFVREDGEWKIDNKGTAQLIEEQIRQGQDELDRIINEGRQP